MKPKVGQYHYELRGSCFRIYRYDQVSDTGTSSSPVYGEPSYLDREEAKKRVYELNGWRYKKQ
ncbi:hypothetical protein OCV73_00205 [Barnesiella propionica]|uniref:hypothetical protein n=1 Tax=Barnesiella propionica TaxID=2981781 RepID=UPI0011CBB4F3|nr:hypothetical protein [Barnesiella propionica]MCU6767384.1 hypothetical protein [Barnesiella propionica]